MKVAIIGGGGRVGSCAAFALQCSGAARELLILDANQATAEGEALDLLHGSAYCADQVIRAGTYSDAADSDIVCITAGLRRKPDESRLDLINRNVALFRSILDSLKEAKLKRDALIFVVSNPVDILTHLAMKHLDWCPKRVIGLGTMLDSSRFSSLIAAELALPATQVRALMLGEHGDSMVPIWSSATLDGLPLTKHAGCTASFQSKTAERAAKSGAEVISRKGGAGWAVGVAIREVIDTIVLDRRRVLPVSTPLSGAYGIRDISLSVPTVVGREGTLGYVELELWPKEMQGLSSSAAALKQTFAKLG